jgi:hypothetical protein
MRRLWIILVVFLSGISSPVFAQHAFDDLPGNDPSANSVLGPNEDPAKKIKDNIFILAGFDRKFCFPGQQVQLTYRLYTALQSTSSITAKPLLTGFTATQLPVDETPLPDKTVDGKIYHGFAVWKVILTPLQIGNYTIDPLTVGNDVSYTTATGATQHYSGPVTSNSPSIRVMPLPPGGQPAGFAGLIGKWQIRNSVTTHRPEAGATDTLLIEISGTGSFDNIVPPVVRWPSGFRHSEPGQQRTLIPNSYPQSGKESIAIPFTASTPGVYHIPPIELAWFDPATEKYNTNHTDSLVIQVSANPSVPAPSPATTAPTPAATQPAPRTDLFLRLIWGLPLAFVLAVILLVWLKSRRNRTGAIPGTADALSTPAGTPSPAGTPTEKFEKLPEEQQYLADIKRSLITFLQTRLKTDAWAEEDLLRLLQEKDNSLAGKIKPVLDLCNRLLYSPNRPEPKVLQELGAKAKAVINTHS